MGALWKPAWESIGEAGGFCHQAPQVHLITSPLAWSQGADWKLSLLFFDLIHFVKSEPGQTVVSLNYGSGKQGNFINQFEVNCFSKL